MATRIDIARAVAEKEQISIQDANSIIGTTIAVLSETVKREEVHLVGLGTFRQVTRKARQGRNPRTGEAVAIPEKTVVRFNPSKSLNPTAAGTKAPAAAQTAKGGAGKSRAKKNTR